MMFGMFFLGIIVLGCVFAFMYLSFNKEDNPLKQQQDTEAVTDTMPMIIVEVADSALLE